ncbi:hypothetical protein FACS1894127_5200 [Clostridia bacterium]|nr:hypothetical protein FACS1894127_5200 [Clostridia bacterium]
MKKVLYFDCTNGISGDMTLGALIHLGADIEAIKSELAKLNVSGYELMPEKAQFSGIAGINLHVLIRDEHHSEVQGHGEENNEDRERDYEEDNGGELKHTEVPDHGEENNQDREHDHEVDNEGHGHRSFSSIHRMILESELSDRVKHHAGNIFSVIARAEAAVHDKPVEDVVFHEVGAVDSIVDIVGTAICLDLLEIDEVYCSPLHDGHGSIRCRHGIIPVPVPAVVEMLKDSEIELYSEDVPTEMVTPTGLGILKGLNAVCGLMPAIKVTGAGYGFGKRDTGRFGGLRVMMGYLRPTD